MPPSRRSTSVNPRASERLTAADRARVIANLREGAGTHFDPQVIDTFLGMEW